ncbi:MAG: hypothetical protein SNJ72_04425 [Fimbriimonadales bacterium]
MQTTQRIAGRERWAWLGWSLAFFVLQAGTPFITVPLKWVWAGTLLSTLLLMATLLGLIFSLAYQTERHRWLSLAMLIGGVLLWTGGGLLPRLLGWSADNRPPIAVFALYQTMVYYLLLVSAVGLGTLLSRIVREKNLLVPVVPFAAMVDVLTVLAPGGFVKRVMEQAPEIAERASVAVTAVPSAMETFERVVPIVIIGVGDFVFLALYAACLWRFQLRVRPTAIGLFLVLWVYLMIVMLGYAPKLPALVPMAVAFLAINWREFRLSPQEKFASLLVVGLVIGFIGWLFWRP